MNHEDKNERGITRYMAEVTRVPLLTRAEELAFAVQFREHGDADAGRMLVVSNLRFVVKICHEYRGYTTKLLDLIQEGNLGLMQAVRKFDPSRGYRLISYAVWWIRAFIQNFIIRSWSLVKLGTTQAQRRLFFGLRTARVQVDRETDNDGAASVTALAKRFRVSEVEVTTMESRLAGHDFSLDAAVDNGASHSHADRLVANGASSEEIAAGKQQDGLLHTAIDRSVRTLDSRQRYIVDHRLMSDVPQTLGEIGAHFQVSRERIRQIENGIVMQLRAQLTTHNTHVSCSVAN